MDIQTFYQFVEKSETPALSDIPRLKTLSASYPYFQSAAFIYLKTVYTFDYDNFETELERLSITLNDRRALFYYIFSEEYEQFFRETGNKDLTKDKTSILLDAFFESKSDESLDTDLEYSIYNSSLASVDYFSFIEKEPETTNRAPKPQENKDTRNLKHQEIIDSFITKSEMEGGIRIQTENTKEELLIDDNTIDDVIGDELDEDMFFTETLAKIYIKQKKYDKAYKIIKHLSLNYPKKNIYFADQLSFLEKLIINSKFKDTK